MLKKDFPLLKSEVVYLDNGATTQKPQVVLDALQEFYTKYNANPHRGIYQLSETATFWLGVARSTVAKFINADENEIIFTKSATEGLNMLAKSLGADLKSSENIIVTQMEHHSNFIPWQQLCKKAKAKFVVAKYDKEKGLESIADLVNSKTRVVAITGMSNVTGEILDYDRIAFDVKQRNPNTLVVVDATQLVAHQRINVQSTDADFIVFSGHKMYGPTGVGVVWGNYDLFAHIEPFLYGGNMILEVTEKDSTWEIGYKKFEAGTLDTPGIYAFGKAIEYLEKHDLDKLFAYEDELKDYALKKLREVEYITVIGHNSRKHGPVISMDVQGVHPHDLAQICADANVCVRAGHHCAQPLITCLGYTATTRISLSFYNTKEDIDAFVDAVKKAWVLMNG